MTIDTAATPTVEEMKGITVRKKPLVYRKTTEQFDWDPFLTILDKSLEFLTQKELRAHNFPIPRIHAFFQPFIVRRLFVYARDELKAAIQKEMKKGANYGYHQAYIDLTEISHLMDKPSGHAERILRHFNIVPIFIHPYEVLLKIYDRPQVVTWITQHKHIIQKAKSAITVMTKQKEAMTNPHLAEELRKYNMTGTQAAAYLGETSNWLFQNRHAPLHSRIPCIQIGKLYRYAKEDLDIYINARKKTIATPIRKFFKHETPNP